MCHRYDVALGTLSHGSISGQSIGVAELGSWEDDVLLGQMRPCWMRVLMSFCDMIPSD